MNTKIGKLHREATARYRRLFDSTVEIRKSDIVRKKASPATSTKSIYPGGIITLHNIYTAMPTPTIEYVNESPFQFGHKADGDSGYDICANQERLINPGKSALISTGIYMAIPKGLEGQVRSRSGLAAKYGIHVLNQPGTIDASYRGEVKVILHNAGDKAYTVDKEERIAQIVFQRVPCTTVRQVEELDETNRGTDGFGSTGQM